MKNSLRYFVQGLLIVVPVAITLVVILKIFSFFGSLLEDVGLHVNSYIDPFIVIAAVVMFIFIIGFLGSTIFFKPLFTVFESAIEKAPLIKIIYSSIKDFLSAFVGNKKRFDKPVLITTNKESGIQELGFITQTDLQDLTIAKEKVAVYIPLSYAFSGKLLIVPKENITVLNISAGEAMKFIVSGGVSEID